MRHLWLPLALSLFLAAPANAAPTPARAPAAEKAGWLLNGETIGGGRNAVHFQLGWPGAFLTFLRGHSDTLDVGGHFGFQYGFEGRPDQVFPGLKLAGIARLNLLRGETLNFGLRTTPGLLMYFPGRVSSIFGLELPVEGMFGVKVLPNFAVHAALGLPMTLLFLPRLAFHLPVQMGPGFEYQVDEALSLTLDTRVGPLFRFERNGPFAELAFQMLLGAGYRF